VFYGQKKWDFLKTEERSEKIKIGGFFMKKTAKLISLLLSALLVLTAMPISAFAEGEAAEKTNLALGKSYTKSVESDMGGGYVDSNGTELTDGVVGPADVSAGEWTVISQAFDVVVDLGANCVFDTFEVVVPTHLSTIALMPMNVAIAYGDTADGEFTEVYNDAIADPGAAKVETLTVTPGEEYTAQFVKFSFSGGAAGWNPVGELRVFGEYKAYSEFFEKYKDSVAADVSNAVNDAYLNMHGQSGGIKTYGYFTDMIVLYFLNTKAI